jgi:WD40 repeat protein
MNSVAFSPDGKRLLAGTNAEKMKIWDAIDWRQVNQAVDNKSQ